MASVSIEHNIEIMSCSGILQKWPHKTSHSSSCCIIENQEFSFKKNFHQNHQYLHIYNPLTLDFQNKALYFI